jgi:hypothetical protein
MTNQETAHYIADMILELRNLAKKTGLTTLQGLLEISFYEASSAANPAQVPAGELQHLEALGADARRQQVA